jgi:hypothetical protein
MKHRLILAIANIMEIQKTFAYCLRISLYYIILKSIILCKKALDLYLMVFKGDKNIYLYSLPIAGHLNIIVWQVILFLQLISDRHESAAISK